jgi:hypothetical protein
LESSPLPTTTPEAPPESASPAFARSSSASSEVTRGPIFSASFTSILVVGMARTVFPASRSSSAIARIALDFPPAPTKAAMSPEEIPSA